MVSTGMSELLNNIPTNDNGDNKAINILFEMKTMIISIHKKNDDDDGM